jgi:hypothetical protein
MSIPSFYVTTQALNKMTNFGGIFNAFKIFQGIQGFLDKSIEVAFAKFWTY